MWLSVIGSIWLKHVKRCCFQQERRGMKLLNHPSHSDERAPKQLPNIWILEAFPSESSTKGANNYSDNIIRTVLLCFWSIRCIHRHLWSPTITYNGNTVCVSYVQVHLGKLWHTSTDLAQLHLTCHCLTEICQWLVWLFMMVLDHPKIISKWRDDYQDTLQDIPPMEGDFLIFPATFKGEYVMLVSWRVCLD